MSGSAGTETARAKGRNSQGDYIMENSTNKDELIELTTLRTQVAILKRLMKKEGKYSITEEIYRIFGWEDETT